VAELIKMDLWSYSMILIFIITYIFSIPLALSVFALQKCIEGYNRL